ncbi:conserved membrane hypothetical protein [Vibrio chagasii]|nr:conserved membrane hypothetical protein [Vibrio chagasii]CAH6905634.1 conserved membrane hypothetical protein [Vibrio chagasii]CAH6990174.1 conserved membrane hypothetical protein [Vibrio chagasii]CAH7013673.1 conserved membrane hypothetical protein [Vibrio chagasii]
MDLSLIASIIIIVAFSIIHLIECIGIHARYAGYICEKGGIGYSIQNSTFVFTRFFYILLMPLMGYIVDHGVSKGQFFYTLHFALIGAGMSTLLVFLSKSIFIDYYTRVIRSYTTMEKGLIYSIIKPTKKDASKKLELIEPNNINLNYMLTTSFVYTVYSLGVFMSFTLAFNFPEYRSSLSHLSGVVNGFATLVFTMKVDPVFSLAIDKKSSDFPSLFKSFILGRLIGVGLFSQIGIIGVHFING